MIDNFTREQFEAALPVDKNTGAALWRGLGVIDGEYQYSIGPIAGRYFIHVRSSVDETGVSASVGEDSIRCYLMDVKTCKPAASKVARWITRQKKWRTNMTATIRLLWKVALCLTPCPVCKEQRLGFKVNKDGPNKGYLFQACGNRDHKQSFEWLKIKSEEKKPCVS
jgi:hypothetical protein